MIFGEPGTPSPFQYPIGVGVGTAAVDGLVGYSAQLARNARAATTNRVRRSDRPVIWMRRVMRPVRGSTPKIYGRVPVNGRGVADCELIRCGSFLPKTLLPDSLTGGGNSAPMHHRSLSLLAVICLAFGLGGCESMWTSSTRQTKKNYQEVLMPLQTGSVLHRRTYVPNGPEEKKKSTKKETKASKPKPDAEPTATPTPEEESTPPPADRFR
jgi:hypothetical protein